MADYQYGVLAGFLIGGFTGTIIWIYYIYQQLNDINYRINILEECLHKLDNRLEGYSLRIDQLQLFVDILTEINKS